MAENVGQALSQHASGLGNAVNSLIKDAIVNDNFAKDAARLRRQEAFKLPSFDVDQKMKFTDPVTQTPQKIDIKMEVPGCISEDGIPLLIKKYRISSTFEAIIRKHHEIDSETNVHVGGKAGFLGIPKVSFDIAEKINTKDSADEKQHNTFDIEIEMGQGEPPVGYTELVKAFVRSSNRLVDYICHVSFQSPEESKGDSDNDNDGQDSEKRPSTSGDDIDNETDADEDL